MVLDDRLPGSLAGRAAVLVAAVVLAVGCAGATATPTPSPAPSPTPAASAGGTSVGAILSEFKIVLAAPSAKAGPVTFQLSNTGTVVHEFVVFKTDLAPDKLPMAADGTTVDEEGPGGLTVVDEVEDIAVGATPTLAVDLPAGRYVLLCNVPAHYTSGMRTAFTTN